MPITGGLILFASIWFTALIISLQVGIKTQADNGNVVPGTPASAPANINMKKRLLIVTIVTIVLWLVIAAIILSGRITLQDIDFFGRLDHTL